MTERRKPQRGGYGLEGRATINHGLHSSTNTPTTQLFGTFDHDSKTAVIAMAGEVKAVKLPTLAPLGLVSLERYRNDLSRMEITREISSLVACCDVILEANRGVRQ